MTKPTRIVFLCTGNAARSVMAATMFADRTSGFDVVSAGTHVIEGLPMSTRTRNALAGVGHANLDHRSHQLVADDLVGAALVIAMEPGHLRYIEREFPDARDRSALFPTVVRLLEQHPVSGELADRVDGFALANVEPAAEDEVIDPAGGEQPDFDASAAELDALVDRLVQALDIAKVATTRPRVASLVPSATDLVAALGHSDQLVAVSHECDHSAAVGLPVATSSNVGAAGVEGGDAPGIIDQQVSDALAAGDALYQTNSALLDELRPDVVVAQEICDVCAVSGPAVAALLPPDTTLLTLTATSLAGLDRDIDLLAAELGSPEDGHELKARIARRISAVEQPIDAPRLLTLEWADPPFVGGHWVPELVELAGAHNVFSTPGAASRRVTWDDIRGAEIDVVVGMQCGYELGIAATELEGAIANGQLAVPSGGVWATAATRLFSRCTDNVAEAVEVLAAISRGIEIPDVAVRVA